MCRQFLQLVRALIVGATILCLTQFGAWVASPMLFFLEILLLAKIFALAKGVSWIWHRGSSALTELRSMDEGTASESPAMRRIAICRFFEKEQQDAPGAYQAPLGLFDCSWRKRVDELTTEGKTGKSAFRHYLREFTFRTETLLILTACTLIGCSFLGDYLTGNGSWCVRAGVLALAVVALMACEMLVGNVLMGQLYSRYCHFHFTDEPLNSPQEHGRVRQIINLFTFIVIFVFAMSSVCQVYFEAFGGFTAGKQLSAEANISKFGRTIAFLSFAWTTFTTTGYGDIAPDQAESRLLVILIQMLSAGVVLVLLQVMLTASSSSPRNREDPR